MVPNKRQDEYKLIAALLHDIQKSHEVVFNTRALRLTIKKLESRYRLEGIGFLTKTLPRLGKAFDKALTEHTKLSAASNGFSSVQGSELPRFLGEFFSLVLDHTGTVLQDPCADSVRVIRQICFYFYKYELPYTAEQESKVVSAFKSAEKDLATIAPALDDLNRRLLDQTPYARRRFTNDPLHVTREARILLSRVFAGFDFSDITPRHGPGAVATKQQLWSKFEWVNVSSRIRSKYPLDAYYYASQGHVCDEVSNLVKVDDQDLPARVVLVPKDSRGPRLISCEPVDFQWIQQGIMTKLVKHIERLNLTRFNVFFTNQGPNRIGALHGSRDGRYVTLDLKEASDRVSLALVRLLFPPHVCEVLEAVRSSSTVLPDGEVLLLAKHAPMGSALCFPILALTVWAILTAGQTDADVRDYILVYGDDVIVPSHYAKNAIERLESYGLKVNLDKSCTNGSFRESCGMDAFKGLDVTPVRLRTPWSSHPSAEVFTSWISYARSMWGRRYFESYDLIVGMLHRVYGPIPEDQLNLSCPSLPEVPTHMRPRRYRINRFLQKKEWLVRDVKAPSIQHEMGGWSMLLRYFTEGAANSLKSADCLDNTESLGGFPSEPFSVRSYTRRRSSMLVRRWR